MASIVGSWPFVKWNIAPFKPKNDKIFLFHDHTDIKYHSISNFTESQAINFISNKRDIRYLLSEQILASPRYPVILKEVNEPFLRKSTGPDLDLIFWEPGRIDRAVACEVKCIRAETTHEDQALIHRSGKLAKGIRQVEQLRQHGFSQLYYLIIIVDDSRNHSEKCQLLRNTDLETIASILLSDPFLKLNEEIGLGILRLTQYVNQPLSMCGGAELMIFRSATVRDQLADCTKKLESIIISTKSFNY